jgi:hypothetical protein
MMRIRLLAVAAVLLSSGPAQAKDVCIHSAALSGWTFVLKNAKTTAGSSGAVQGYAVRDDGLSDPISGGYVVFPGFTKPVMYVGITRYLSGLNVTNFTGGIIDTTSFHQLSAPLDPMQSSTDYVWTRDGGSGTITSTFGDTHVVDCKTVPQIPKKQPTP